jgi:hypothetical protein
VAKVVVAAAALPTVVTAERELGTATRDAVVDPVATGRLGGTIGLPVADLKGFR